MPDSYDQYRRHSKIAKQLADKSKNEHDLWSWLKLARGWLSLIRYKARRSDDVVENDKSKE